MSEVDFDEIEKLFWERTKDRLESDKPISDTAMARMLEYFRARAEVRLEEAKELARLAEQAQRSNPVATIMANTGLPRVRRIELLEQERETLLGELKACEDAMETLLSAV